MIYALTDSDRIAISMLTMVLLALGTVGLLAFCIYRNSKKLRSPEDDLMDEVTEESRKPKKPVPTPSQSSKAQTVDKKEDWEKDPEWWKA